MKIAILLPYKEDYTPKFAGAVSIHISNLYKYSKYKKHIMVFGNTKNKKYLSKNFKNKIFYLVRIKNIYQNLFPILKIKYLIL